MRPHPYLSAVLVIIAGIIASWIHYVGDFGRAVGGRHWE